MPAISNHDPSFGTITFPDAKCHSNRPCIYILYLDVRFPSSMSTLKLPPCLLVAVRCMWHGMLFKEPDPTGSRPVCERMIS